MNRLCAPRGSLALAIAFCLLASGAAVVVAPASGGGAVPPVGELRPSKVAQAAQLLDEGMRLYRIGEYTKAAEKFDQLLALEPDSELALLMRQRAGIDQLVKMLSREELADKAYKLLALSQKEVERVRTDPEHIQGLIKKFISPDFVERFRSQKELAAVGEYAVPYLLVLLDVEQEPPVGMTREERVIARAYAQRTLEDMTVRAVLPLVEALHSKSVALKIQVCKVLAKWGDARAIPALRVQAEDRQQPARLTEPAAEAVVALAKRAGAPADRTGAECYLSLAESYYYADPRIIDFVPGLERIIWNWNEEGKTYPEQIVYKKVPQYAYNELMAEKLICEGLGIGPDTRNLQRFLTPGRRMEPSDTRRKLLSLLVANSYGLMAEARALASGAPTPGKPDLPAEVRQEAKQRAEALEAARALNRLIGSSSLHDALLRCLKDGDYAQARECIEDLKGLSDTTIPEAENALLKAIYVPVPGIRFPATEALLRISPDGGMGGVEQTVANIIGACSAQTMPSAVVVTDDQTLHARINQALAKANCGSERVPSTADAIRRAGKELPFVSLIVIDARVEKELTAMVSALKMDAVTQFIPLLVLAPAEDVPARKQELTGKGVDVLALSAEDSAVAQSAKQALTTATLREEPTAAARQRLIGLLEAVASLPAGTRYPIGACGGAVSGLLARQPDEVRLPALKALGKIASPVALGPVVTLCLSEQAPSEIRLEAGRAAAAILMASSGKDGLRLDESQRKGLLALSQKAEASAELRALAARLFSIIPLEKAPAPGGTGVSARKPAEGQE